MIKHGGIFSGDITRLDVSSGRSDLNFILYWLPRGSICRVFVFLGKLPKETFIARKFVQDRIEIIYKKAMFTNSEAIPSSYYLLSTPFRASHYRFLFSISSHEFTCRALHVTASRAPAALVISIADATHIPTRGNCSRHHPSESFMM